MQVRNFHTPPVSLLHSEGLVWVKEVKHDARFFEKTLADDTSHALVVVSECAQETAASNSRVTGALEASRCPP